MDYKVKKYSAYIGDTKQAYPFISPGQSFYSRSVVVGNLIFTSAMSPISAGSGKIIAKTVEDQVIAVLDNLRIAVEEAGGSMNNIVRNTIFVKNIDDYPRVRKAEVDYYQKYAPLLIEDPPASSIMIANLEAPEYLVQMDALGVITRGEPDWEVKKYPIHYGGGRLENSNAVSAQDNFSRSAVVGNLVFCSGANARSLITGEVETNNLEEQMGIALDKVKMSMEEAGGCLGNLVKTNIFLKHVSDDYSRMRKTETEYYMRYSPSLAEDPPASTVCQANFENQDCLVQIDAIGIVSKNISGWKARKYPAYYGGIKFAYPHVSPGQPMFSRSAEVGNLIFCSGATGLALGTFKQSSEVIEEQMEITMSKIKMYMEQAGSSLENLIKTIIFIRNMEDYPAIRKAELEYYQMHAPALVAEPPASTVVESSFHQSETLVEIQSIGVIK